MARAGRASGVDSRHHLHRGSRQGDGSTLLQYASDAAKQATSTARACGHCHQPALPLAELAPFTPTTSSSLNLQTSCLGSVLDSSRRKSSCIVAARTGVKSPPGNPTTSTKTRVWRSRSAAQRPGVQRPGSARQRGPGPAATPWLGGSVARLIDETAQVRTGQVRVGDWDLLPSRSA